MGTRIIDQKYRRQQSAFSFSPNKLVNFARQNTANKFRTVQIGLVLADSLMLGLALWVAYKLRFDAVTTIFFAADGAQDVAFYRFSVFLIIPVWLLLFRLFKMYDTSILFHGHQEYTNLFNATTVGIMLVILIMFLDPTLVIARAWVLMAWLLTVFFVGIERFTIRRMVYSARRNGHFLTPTYIVGANAEGIAIAEQLISMPTIGINVIGFIDDTMQVGEEVVPGVAVHGSSAQAEQLCAKFGIERMIVATSGVERENLLNLFKRFVNVDDVAVWLSSGMYEMLTTGVRVQDIGSMAMISVNRVRLTGINVILKTLLDYTGAIIGLTVLSPLFIAIIIIMKRTDPGPIFHRRRVVGVGGKQFDAFKFRTMVVNADEVLKELLDKDPAAREEYERDFKLNNDPRITRIGQFLRKTSVDELPQLINVLRGEMSIVGPRMITLEEVQRYGQWDMNIHTVKPGITGLWQISGRSDISYKERVQLDMHYIRNYSIWMDLQIIFWTVPAVAFGWGAY